MNPSAQPTCLDAVVVVPGILGSELIDPNDDNSIVWGLRAKPLFAALVTGSIYERLRDPRLKPGGLLRVSGNLPGFGRIEPYTALVNRIRRCVRDDTAILEYPYDWRRPVKDIAAEFAIIAAQHLAAWREHRSGSRDATLTLIGHSMGGLICFRAGIMHRDSLPVGDIRQIVTLGTPYGGSVKAVRAVSTGEVLPVSWAIPRGTKNRLRCMARDTPAVHDLLPSHPSLLTFGTTARRPDLASLTAAGADRDLTQSALNARKDLENQLSTPGHVHNVVHALVGGDQPTLQSFATADDETTFHESLDGINHGGDGTVYFGAAYPKGGNPATGLPQDHGQVAKTEEALFFVQTKLLGGPSGPPQGTGLGFRTPEAGTRNQLITIHAVLPKGTTATCTWKEPNTGSTGVIDLGPATPYNDTNERVQRTAQHAWDRAGNYTLTLSGGGTSDLISDIVISDDDT